jgi:hypothetical protein
MGQMTAGGVAMQNLPQEELYGSDRRAHAVAPPALSNLATHCEDGVGLQPCGPLACETLKDGGDTRDPGVTSCTMGVLIPIHTGDARRIPPSTRPHEIDHEFCLTSCHSTQTPDELLACWERLTPDDWAILIQWARLLAATDLPKALSHEVRGVMTWEKALVLTRANQVRRRRLGLPEDPEDEQ